MSETHLSEITIDQGTHASGVGDLAFSMTKGEEITKNNPLQGQKTSEIPLEEDGVPYPSWLKEVMQEVKESEVTKPKGPKIPMVSTSRFRGDRECYVPWVVSIGPYHHPDRTGRLGDVEKHKASMTRQFVKACGENALKKLCTEMPGVAKHARSFYHESTVEQFNDEEFLKMMFIDGCFILQFIHCIMEGKNKKLEMTDEQVRFVNRDLVLLENQLPFPVLNSLMSARYRKFEGTFIIKSFLYRFHILGPGPRDRKWLWVKEKIRWAIFLIAFILCLPLRLIIVTVGKFFPMIVYFPLSDKISSYCHGLRICLPDSDQPPELQREVEEASGEDNQPAHLLELLYSIFMQPGNGKGKYSKLIPGKTERPSQGSGHYLYYSAKNLKKVGIHFQPIWCGGLTDVKFKSSIFFGTLKLPAIRVNESTKSLLLNLVEYERSTSPDQFWVASYICFMDSLINDAKDVKELRSKGIIINYLGGDEKVADLFNDMGSCLKPDASTYNDVKWKINEQCESMISKWVAEWQKKYFGSPWAFIAVVAAAFGLALTVAQTYLSRYPPSK